MCLEGESGSVLSTYDGPGADLSCPRFCTVSLAKNAKTPYLNGKTKTGIFCDLGKLYKIQICVSINKVLL